MKIIYKTPENTVAILTPSPEWNGTMEELGQKDVPTGCKFKIVEDSVVETLNSDRTFRNAWEVDEAELTDGVGA